MAATSYSQWGQDRWVVDYFRGKRKGFFLEIGAGDGIWISNTLLLEREYGWTGILVEPTRTFEKLVTNRSGCICEAKCISSERQEMTIVEIFDRGQAGIDDKASDNTLLSTVTEGDVHRIDDFRSSWGVPQKAYKVPAVPLADLLDAHHAPAVIDYFSLDVEGHEFEVLRNFPFERYAFACLSVERPHAELRELLTCRGYKFREKLGQDLMFAGPTATENGSHENNTPKR